MVAARYEGEILRLLAVSSREKIFRGMGRTPLMCGWYGASGWGGRGTWMKEGDSGPRDGRCLGLLVVRERVV